jgi:hypothetical protein
MCLQVAKLAGKGAWPWSTVEAAWRALCAAMPPSFRVEPLYGLSCADSDCIGIVEGSSDCVCYKP